MDTEEIKQYLETELPDFKYKTDDNPVNENKVWIEREGQHMVLDVHKVTNKKDLKKLKEYIEINWKAYEKSQNMVS